MSSIRTLFIGGTGIISSACVSRALERGHAVTVLNRGTTTKRAMPDGVEVVHGDIREPESVRSALGSREFDVVCEFLAFTPDHVATDVGLFSGRVGQYVFISSASVYRKPPARVPVIESSPIHNPFWQYSADKIACEDALVAAYRATDFPVTIVRPSHTYDRTAIPTLAGWTDIARMRRGAPVVVHGDGTSLWTLTHADDFAIAFTGLLGRPEALGDTFHITMDAAATWDEIYTWLAHAAGVEPEIVHVASDTIARAKPELGPGLIGDKAHSMVFDNSKVKRLVPEFTATVPFVEGARQIVDWYDADPGRQVVDADMDALFDRLVAEARG